MLWGGVVGVVLGLWWWVPLNYVVTQTSYWVEVGLQQLYINVIHYPIPVHLIRRAEEEDLAFFYMHIQYTIPF